MIVCDVRVAKTLGVLQALRLTENQERCVIQGCFNNLLNLRFNRQPRQQPDPKALPPGGFRVVIHGKQVIIITGLPLQFLFFIQ